MSETTNPNKTELPEGLFLFDKPAGKTSFDCVHFLKRQLGATRVGHCGTLDPAAQGLLILLVGRSTKTQEHFLGLEKEYRFRARLGMATNTGDRDGEIIQTMPAEHVKQENLEQAIAEFHGTLAQMPPLYSALKYKGKPYYHYARKGKGEEIPRVPRSVTIYQFELTGYAPPFWEGRVVCSRGTYIRTLVEDVARRLGTCAVLEELSRERIGPYRREDAWSWNVVASSDVQLLRRYLKAVSMDAVVALA